MEFLNILLHNFMLLSYPRENIETERFNSRFLRDHLVARPMDLYNKIDWAILSLPRYLAGVGPLCYSILSGTICRDNLLNMVPSTYSCLSPIDCRSFDVTSLTIATFMQQNGRYHYSKVGQCFRFSIMWSDIFCTCAYDRDVGRLVSIES